MTRKDSKIGRLALILAGSIVGWAVIGKKVTTGQLGAARNSSMISPYRHPVPQGV